LTARSFPDDGLGEVFLKLVTLAGADGKEELVALHRQMLIASTQKFESTRNNLSKG
jgi:hypothetical protein